MPEPILTGLLTAALFRAVEKIWEESAKAAWTPGTDAIRARVLRWTGKDRESQRRAAFGKAAATARANTVKRAGDPAVARKVLDILDGKVDKRAAEALAEEGAKLLLFADRPDLDRLTRVCQRAVGFEAIVSGEETLPAATIAPVLAAYLDNLREALLDQEAYADLVQKDMRGVLREILAELRPVDYNDEATYRRLMAEMHSRLDFVGIPELKERQPITVEDIFVKLNAEQETTSEGRDLSEMTRQAEAKGDPESLAWLQEARERMARGITVLPTKQRVTVSQMLRDAPRTVILGEPGAGKTTLLKYLVVICAEGRAEAELGLTASGSLLPVFIPLREFAAECATRDGDYCLLDYLYTHAREHLMLNLPRNFFEEALAAGRCLVCLDGLDEVWAVDRRKAITDAVRALASRYRDNRYLVTSRIVGYKEAPLDSRDFVHHTILPLEDADIAEFIRKWYTARERDALHRDERIKDLLNTLEREPRIRDLARNPLLLTIIALVHRIEAELPHERVKLYDKCVTALVDTWDEVKGLTIVEKQRTFFRERRRLLERLAYELHTGAEGPGQLRTIKAGDLELLLARFLMENRRLGFADDPDAARDEAAAFVRLARGRTGLLVERGEGVFGFPHLTFEEYLAACDIEHRCMAYGVDAVWHEIAVKHSLHDPHWREVILLLLGSLNRYEDAPTLLVERILQAGEADPFEPVLHRNLYLAMHALADRVEVAADLRRRIVDDAMAIARDGPPWERQDAVEALSHLNTIPYAADQLLALTRDAQASAEVRSVAAQALGQLGWADEATLAVLLATACDMWVATQVRSTAAGVLVQLGRADEATTILLALAHDRQVVVRARKAAAQTLGQLGRIDEATTILLVLARDRQVAVEVRRSAAEALGQLGRADEAVLAGLLVLARDRQVAVEVRRSATEALGQLGRTDEAVLAGLLVLARDRQVAVSVRQAAAEALGQLGRTDEAVLAGLLVLARDRQVAVSVRQAAAEALGQLGRADEATAILLALARDQRVDPCIRSAAAGALGQLGRADEATAILLALARDTQEFVWVRSAAAGTLGQLGRADEAVLAGLLALVRDQRVDPGIRSTAAGALGQLGRADGATLAILLALARDRQVAVEVRRAAVGALGRLGRADEALLAGLLALAREQHMGALIHRAAYESLKRLLAG